jgi:nucleoside-diphosphate kinase
MSIEQSFVMLKPDALKRSLTGNVFTRLSETKLDIVALKVVKVDERLARTHYHNLELLVQQGEMQEEIYEGIIQYIMGALHDEARVHKVDGWEHIRRKVVPIVYMGKNAVSLLRDISGHTHPEKGDPTSIRGQYGRVTSDRVWENIIHSSANVREARKEVKLWFKPDELREKLDIPEFQVSYSDSYYFMIGEETERLMRVTEGRFQNGVFYFAQDNDVYLLNSGLLYKLTLDGLSNRKRKRI